MQESVLARRTIHFSAKQTYFKCGDRVYCENLTRLRKQVSCDIQANTILTMSLFYSLYWKKYFIANPNFLSQLLYLSYRRILEFICFLIKDYLKRELTYKTNRCVAISRLQTRIAYVLDCKGSYSTFQKYLYRNLLWHASNVKLKKIKYKTLHVPSWLQMAYNRGV